MRTSHLSLPLALALGLSAASLQAQDPAPASAPERSLAASKNFRHDRELRGLRLTTRAHADAETPAVLAEICDFIVNARSGAVTHVILTVDDDETTEDRFRLLPWNSIRWGESEEGAPLATTDLSPRAFGALPKFPARLVDNLTGSKAVEANAKRIDRAQKGKGARVAADKAAASHRCTELADFPIYGPGERKPFSTVGDLILDCDHGAVAFMTVNAHEETYLVPFRAMSVRPVTGEAVAGEEEALEHGVFAPVNAEGMKGAPTLDAAQERSPRIPRFRRAVYEHYGIDVPAYDKKKGKSDPTARSNG